MHTSGTDGKGQIISKTVSPKFVWKVVIETVLYSLLCWF